MLYVQLAAFPIVAAAGILLGRWCGMRRGWWLAVMLPLALIGLVILGRRSARLHFVAPMRWVVDADLNPLLMTAGIGLMFPALLVRLPRKTTRYLVAAAMAVMQVNYGLLPALLPLAARGSLASTATVINTKGVCLQQHAYSCGPAAAVTCLRQLGVPAEEGALAIAAHCSPAFGTDGFLLAAAAEQSRPGLTCTYHYVATLDELRPPAVADMQMPVIGGHYVAVLAVEPDGVLVGDPLSGLGLVPRDEFLAEWKHGAIEFQRH